MLSNARIFIDRGSPIFRVGIGSPMWIEGAEDGHSGNDQNSECCLDGYGEAKCLQRARTTASENFTFQSGYHAPAMKCGQSQHGGEQRQLDQQQLAMNAVEQGHHGPTREVAVVQDAGDHKDADEDGAGT